MGQKVNPIALRLGITKNWASKWYANRDYVKKLHEDLKIQYIISKTLYHAGISTVHIERPANKTKVIIFASRPGVVIGKKGSDIEKIKKILEDITSNEVSINIVEERKPETNPLLVAQAVATQLEKRVAFRRAMKKAVQSAMRLGADGIRINVSGRLGGAEIARTEWYREGRVPLHTLRNDIGYGTAQALTTYGLIGVKVWIYKSEQIDKENKLMSVS